MKKGALRCTLFKTRNEKNPGSLGLERSGNFVLIEQDIGIRGEGPVGLVGKALQNVSFKGTINVDIAMNGCQKLTVASLLSLLNALAPGANKTCKIGTTNITKLTEEQRMIAINKGWQLV